MSVNPEFVERYQLEYEKNPTSKVFAPLAEAYRKMGMLEEAHRICKRGVQIHPDFAGGRVAFAKVLIDSKQFGEALPQLERATQLSPDNLLAHSLMGDVLIELRRPKDALKSFKMVLFLNPSDEKARQAVKKWEFLTADDYEDEAFAMKPVYRVSESDLGLEAPEPESAPTLEARLDLAQRQARALERAISLADAFTVRNDLPAAVEVLEDARRLLGPLPELENRFKLISKRLEVYAEANDGYDSETLFAAESGMESETEAGSEPLTGSVDSGFDRERRIDLLEMLLHRINERREGG